jgi:hypothetical protein
VVRALPVGVAVVLMVYTLIDCLQTDSTRIRSLNKAIWMVVIILIPIIGPILWLMMATSHRQHRPQPRRQLPPDDDPAFLQHLSQIDSDPEQRLNEPGENIPLDGEDELRQHSDDEDDGH